MYLPQSFCPSSIRFDSIISKHLFDFYSLEYIRLRFKLKKKFIGVLVFLFFCLTRSTLAMRTRGHISWWWTHKMKKPFHFYIFILLFYQISSGIIFIFSFAFSYFFSVLFFISVKLYLFLLFFISISFFFFISFLFFVVSNHTNSFLSRS